MSQIPVYTNPNEPVVSSDSVSSRDRDWSFEVVDMDGVRIDKLLVRPPHVLNEREQNEGALAMGAVLPPVESEQRNHPQIHEGEVPHDGKP